MHFIQKNKPERQWAFLIFIDEIHQPSVIYIEVNIFID
ncbi:hypothetical protein L581_2529 [Serratia fonticola AU-AP2C]|nr:hypothetical protein L581_2529 [Serratia fonticola AU-AP2C]